MALLSDNDRAGVWADMMRENTEPFGALTKVDLRAAVDAIDSWLDANFAALNAAIPLPARSQLTRTQKVRLLVTLVRKRYLSGV